MGRSRPKLLFLITEDWYFWTHRLALARAARDAGFDVVIASRISKYRTRIEAEGFTLVGIKLRRSGRNPFTELASIIDLAGIFRRERPDIVHQVSIKPVLYGSMAACFAGCPALVNAVTGLGHVFVTRGLRASLRRSLVLLAYRLALASKRSRVIFQNPDDREFFLQRGVVDPASAVLIRGAGVNLEIFRPAAEPEGLPLVVLAGRLLWTKGVAEFVEAAQRLRTRGVQCRFALVGVPDTENPMAIPDEMLKQWQCNAGIEIWGHREDMVSVLQQATVVVLPTIYGEGIPKILLEAAACGKPLVATNIPGCTEIVRHEENGLLVPPRDPEALAEALNLLLSDAALRAQMGHSGRDLVEREFSESRVVDQTLAVYWELLRAREEAG